MIVIKFRREAVSEDSHSRLFRDIAIDRPSSKGRSDIDERPDLDGRREEPLGDLSCDQR
jgi:hypothetical protein